MAEIHSSSKAQRDADIATLDRALERADSLDKALMQALGADQYRPALPPERVVQCGVHPVAEVVAVLSTQSQPMTACAHVEERVCRIRRTPEFDAGVAQSGQGLGYQAKQPQHQPFVQSGRTRRAERRREAGLALARDRRSCEHLQHPCHRDGP